MMTRLHLALLSDSERLRQAYRQALLMAGASALAADSWRNATVATKTC